MTALSRSQWLFVCLIVAGAFSMEFLDSTVITTALPLMGKSFHVNPVELSIGLTAYLMTMAAFIPVSSWMADHVGSRTVFVSALGLFTLASAFCGLCSTVDQFVLARVAQGIGGAMMVPVGRFVVLRTTEKKDLIDAMALLTWPALAAPILGPPVGGFIATYWSWHWIFFLNLPLGIAGIIASLILMPNLKAESKKPFDTIGFVLTGLSLSCIMYGLDRAGVQSASNLPLYVIAMGVLLGAAALFHVRRHPYPIIDLWPMRVQTFSATIWGGSLFRTSISAMPFLVPLMLQIGFGMSAFAAGALSLWIFIGNLGMKVVTTPILRRFGFKATLLVNGLVCVLSIAACAFLMPQTPLWTLAAIFLLGGLCRSMQFTAVSTLSYADIPPQHMSGASAFGSLAQQVANGLGVPVGALVLHLAVAFNGHHGAPIASDFHLAFGLLAFMTALGLISYWRLPGDAGAKVSAKSA